MGEDAFQNIHASMKTMMPNVIPMYKELLRYIVHSNTTYSIPKAH
jgi:hypothetical protein